MKRTEYSKIAPKYDKNPIRHVQLRDPHIAKILKPQTGDFGVLDLACGTDSFLCSQQNYLNSDRLTNNAVNGGYKNEFSN